MEATELRRRLDELHAELARTQSVEPRSRELLEGMRRDIEELLARSDPSGQHSLRGRLDQAVRHFEVTHPALTATIGRVIDQLSNLGI